jgi:hypothetical protein
MVKKLINSIREGEELKAPRHTSAAATHNGNLPSRDGKLPYMTAICLIPDNFKINLYKDLYLYLIVVNYTLYYIAYYSYYIFN